MTRYMFATGPCACCRRLFSFNPLSVPSTSALTGDREPICATCIASINEKRKAKALAPWPVAADAYGVAAEADA